eukprot:11204903-Lingulodinium_polyedra.AAC.1
MIETTKEFIVLWLEQDPTCLRPLPWRNPVATAIRAGKTPAQRRANDAADFCRSSELVAFARITSNDARTR